MVEDVGVDSQHCSILLLDLCTKEFESQADFTYPETLVYRYADQPGVTYVTCHMSHHGIQRRRDLNE